MSSHHHHASASQDTPSDEEVLPERDPSENEAGQDSEASASEGPDYQAEAAKLKDQLLRALAEAENTRRRMQKELDDARKYAVSSFAKEILTVSDNFQRALDSVPKEGASADTLTQLVAGVEATERQLQAILERFGIKKIEPLGQMFDPNYHRVMMEQEDPSKVPGTVTMVLQAGYMIHDRLLREAMVAVAKGGSAHKSEGGVHKVDTSA